MVKIKIYNKYYIVIEILIEISTYANNLVNDLQIISRDIFYSEIIIDGSKLRT